MTFKTKIKNAQMLIEKLDEAKYEYEQAKSRYQALKDSVETLSQGPGYEELKQLYDHCKKHGNYSRKYIFVGVALILYSPTSILHGKLHSTITNDIARVLGINPTNIYRMRGQIEVWLESYDDFREAIRNQDISFLLDSGKV